MLKSIKNKLRKDYLNKKWKKFNFLMTQFKKFDKSILIENNDIRELEHQVGRFLNMKAVKDEIVSGGLKGDILEFGTWQGLGMIYLSNIFENENIKYIGVDSFEGLPDSSTIWKKGSFNDTSEQNAKENILKFGKVNPENLYLIKGWFDDPYVKKRLSEVSDDILLVHLDADLGSSTKVALELLESFLLNRTKPLFLLFDDWGCHPDEVPDAFWNWVLTNHEKYKFNLKKLCSTNLTRYYKLDFVQ